jgi:hypothetical protein
LNAGGRLRRLQAVIDASGVPARVEAMLPIGVRPRQLSVRTLLLGMLLALSDGRPAHLRRVHEALRSLPGQQQRQLGVLAQWKSGPHLLTYRQVERTFMLIVRALCKAEPDGEPSRALCEAMDALLEASFQTLGAPRSSSLAVDWTDQETWSRPPRKRRAEAESAEPRSEDAEHPTPQKSADSAEAEDAQGLPENTDANTPEKDTGCADPEASYGHRRGDGPGQKDDAFYGSYLQAATIVKEEDGPEVPELTRRILLTSCHVDPPAAFTGVLGRMAADGIAPGDVLADSGYAYRQAESWALPLRRLGAALVQDLHPNDRGLKGTHMGAVPTNGNLCCPATPKALLELGPLPPGAGAGQTSPHDQQTAELFRYKLAKITGYDHDGYHRACCPATQGKLRCPLRPPSMELTHTRPQVLQAPEHPPKCCRQQTITVPPAVNAKTTQKHDYPSRSHRRSYARRSAAERTYSTIKDPAANDISRGWRRLMGLTPTALLTTCLFIVRNIRVADAFTARRAEEARRQACGLPPRKRRRRRRGTLHDLLAEANAPPARRPAARPAPAPPHRKNHPTAPATRRGSPTPRGARESVRPPRHAL